MPLKLCCNFIMKHSFLSPSGIGTFTNMILLNELFFRTGKININITYNVWIPLDKSTVSLAVFVFIAAPREFIAFKHTCTILSSLPSIKCQPVGIEYNLRFFAGYKFQLLFNFQFKCSDSALFECRKSLF